MKKILFGLLTISFTVSYSQVIITEIYHNTPFSEHYDRGYPFAAHHLGEFIELYNYSTEDIPLKGWYITDHVSRYNFPNNAVIPSEGFIIVAYRDLYYGPSTGNYFTNFFPSTQGKDAQIFYQGSLMLRNNIEDLHIHMGEIRGIDFKGYTLYSTGYEFIDPPTNYDANVTNYSSVPSLHLTANGNYNESTPSPLDAAYVPPTQNLEEIVSFQEALIENTANQTWSHYANLLISMSCPLVINYVEQTPSDIYLDSGKCFSYDISGNNVSSIDCLAEEESDNNNPVTEFTSAEIDEIASQIYLTPNPTAGVVHISWEDSVIGKISSIQVVNTAGISIGPIITITSVTNSTNFNIINQPSGIYIVNFTLITGQFISKNVIKT